MDSFELEVYLLMPRNQQSLTEIEQYFGLDGCKELAADYSVPQYAESPELVFERWPQLRNYLLTNPRADYLVEWGCNELMVTLLFGEDASLVVGFGMEGVTVRDAAERMLTVASDLDASRGMVVDLGNFPEDGRSFEQFPRDGRAWAFFRED